ncbi:MAG: metalloregulator ArsR/SmtB family transcription factor [Candidatus Pelagadaptatus aseana]|uniref:metalloregulator ArsR/SmtB family transcription factor n=1 Tax=Candidatus Pelagadaptatus aseana TaxID=3120508 RepID=UPI0039B36477
MSSSTPLPIEAQQATNLELAALLKAAGDPLRLDILRLLGRDSLGVMELSRIFDVKQSGMSHHLKVLANANLVVSRREGNSIFYRRALPQFQHQELIKALFDSVDLQPLSADNQIGLGKIQEERAQASRDFFANNAEKFREQQDLIASYPAYAEAALEMLDSTPLSARQAALEIGPGEGQFLKPLSNRFEQVIALDNSASMLQQAKNFCHKEQLQNIEFIHGDTRAATEQHLKVDCIVLNMVLHHTPSPASILLDASTLLNPGGAVVMTDLCHHDQQWAKEACGDLWLGLDPDDLSNWARQAGLTEGESQYIALRNGFQIQFRQFFKPAH